MSKEQLLAQIQRAKSRIAWLHKYIAELDNKVSVITMQEEQERAAAELALKFAEGPTAPMPLETDEQILFIDHQILED